MLLLYHCKRGDAQGSTLAKAIADSFAHSQLLWQRISTLHMARAQLSNAYTHCTSDDTHLILLDPVDGVLRIEGMSGKVAISCADNSWRFCRSNSSEGMYVHMKTMIYVVLVQGQANDRMNDVAADLL
jgi:hypothetical protein